MFWSSSAAARRALLLVFVFSGASGLIYEIVWMRRLALVFGSTTLAVSTVLAAYMGGLALGSRWLGAFADRHPSRALRTYAWLEIAIGILALLVPLLFRIAGAVYLSLYPALADFPQLFFFVQFLLVGAVIVVPTTLMGGTLPLLARALVHSIEKLGGRVGVLYAANTFGAALGTALTTYWLLPYLGLWRAELAGAAMNLAAGVTVLLLFRESLKEEPEREGVETGDTVPPRAARALLLGTALSGFSAMVFEVVWSRTLALVLGSSVYAFGMMLLVFLGGLALGSSLFARMRLQPAGSAAAFALAQAGIVGTGLLSAALIPQLPALFFRFFPLVRDSFFLQQLLQLLVAGALLLPAAALFGIAFPAVIAATTTSTRTVGGGVGRVVAFNTVGTVAGAFLGGFVLVPRLGIRATLFLAAAASGVAAIAALGAPALAARPRRRVWIAGGVAAALLGALAVPPWPREVMASGIGFFAGLYQSADEWRASRERSEILFYKDGVNTTLSVEREGAYRYYRSNGKTDASTHPTDLAVQVLLGQVPMLLHPNPRDVFVLGLGTGVSAAAIARHPVRSIDIVDIEPAGKEAARFFEPENRNVLADPRVRFHVADGRNLLLARDKLYDVILCDPSDVWVAGVASLYTREFYELARRRLKPNGVFVQWWHTHALPPEPMRLIIATLHGVFPHATYWRPAPGDVMMVGSADPVLWDQARLQTQFETVPGLADDLRGIGMWHPLSLFAAFTLETPGVERLIAGARGIHSDDHPVIEFFAPRYLYGETTAAHEATIERLQTSLFPPVQGFEEARDLDSRALYLLGFAYASLGRTGGAIALMERSVAGPSPDPKFLVGLGNQYRQQGEGLKAMRAYERALTIDPGDTEASGDLSDLLREAGDDAGAERVLAAALARAPRDPSLAAAAAGRLLDAGQPERALPILESALAASPEEALLNLLAGRALAAAGRREEAVIRLRRAAAGGTGDAALARAVGDAFLDLGELKSAGDAYRRAFELDPNDVAALVGLARVGFRDGDPAAGRAARDRARRLDPYDPEVLALPE